MKRHRELPEHWHHRHRHRFGPRGAPLHRRIFWWFGLTILSMGAVTSCVARLLAPGGTTLRAHALLAFVTSGVTLWLASFIVARRIGRPLRELAIVAREIGEGKLGSRVQVGWHQPGEVGMVAESINDMAARIEKQLSDQRELVAAVSHEIRAPLSRLRVLVELVRERGADDATLAKLDREIVEIDSLVGDLLASSRLEFALVQFRGLDAAALAAEALDRAGLPADRLIVQTTDTRFEGDATLVARALANLLENAARHGNGATRIVVRDGDARTVAIEVEDDGPGFSPDVLPRAFEAFQRGQVERRGSTSLGLGLALVRRIADAHEGTVKAENRAEGGRGSCSPCVDSPERRESPPPCNPSSTSSSGAPISGGSGHSLPYPRSSRCSRSRRCCSGGRDAPARR